MLRLALCAFSILLFSTKLGAENKREFFTWVDAQGRIHNSPVNHKKDSQNTPKQSLNKSEPDNKKEIPNDEYLTEEEFDSKQQQKRQESPAFFTWVDTNGQVHNQWIPAYSEKPKSGKDDLSEQYFDEVFVKPLRLKNTTNADCCTQYGSYFSSQLKPSLSYHFIKLKAKPAFAFANESAPAFYFNLGPSDGHLRKLDIIQLYSSLKPSVIALDRDLKPLYQSHSLKGVTQEKSWYQTKQIHFALQLDDADIQYLIWYYPNFIKDEKSLDKLELLLFLQPQPSS